MSFELRVLSFECAPSTARRELRLPTRNSKPETRNRIGGFTLIEIMVVVAIMAIVMTIGVPFMSNALNGGKGMNRAVKDIQEACKTAREWAILRQAPQELRIRVDDAVYFEVGPSSAPDDVMGRKERYLKNLASQQQGQMFSPDVDGRDWRMEGGGNSPPSGGGGGNFSIQLPDGVGIEAILANGFDMTEAGGARVVFRPNGTCDELNLVLFRPESNERRQLWLEITTGYTEIESNPAKFRDPNQ